MVRAGVAALIAPAPGQQVGQTERSRAQQCWGHRSRIAGFYTPSPRAPSHLPWVDEQEVPQPSQVLFHLKIKPPGQDTTYSRVQRPYLYLYMKPKQ